MFEAFYGMTATPFTRDLPPEALYGSAEGDEILGRLEYAAARQWFAVVTGDWGTGKSTAIRRLAARLDRAHYQLLSVADSKRTPRPFYKGLLDQLGCEAKFYRGEAKRQLHREMALLKAVHQRPPVVVVVDEAHLLAREMLAEVRFLLLCRIPGYAESHRIVRNVARNGANIHRTPSA
jgi:type II secretory pathway predicted ATPase ExeA